MALKFRRGTTAQQSGSLVFGEPYVNTTLGTLVVGGATGDIVLSTSGTGSTGTFGAISGSGLDITGNANIAGNVTVGGQLTIGDATADTVNVVASLSSSLIPQTTNAFDLGSATKIWRDLYISSGSIKMYDGSGALVSTITATSLNSNTSSVNALNSFSASQLTQNSTLATYTGSVDTRLTEIGVVSGSLISSASAASVSISNLNTFSGSQLTQNTALATVTGSLISSASVAKTTNDAQDVSITNLNTNSASVNTSVTNINSYTSSLKTALSLSGADLTVLGNFTVQGDTTTLNTANLLVEDKLIEIAVGSTTSAAANGAGIYISGANASILWDDAASTLDINKSIDIAGNITLTGNVDGVDVSVFNSNINTTTASLNTSVSNLNSFTSSINTTIKSKLDADGVISSSTQLTTTFDSRYLNTGGDGVVSGSAQIDVASTTGDIVLGTRTSGNYVASLVAGTNITLSNNTGEGATPTIGLTNNTISGISLGSNLAALTISTGLSGTSYNGSGAVTIANTGVTSNVAGTGVTVSGATGAVTISIGQAVATTSNVQFGSIGVGMAASGTSGRIDAANDVVAFSTSDIRFKENITPIPNAIEKIRKISGNTYDWKADLKDVHGYEGNDVGVIAQEIEEVLPQLVQNRDNGYKAVKYDKLVALLIEGIKEQQQHIDNLTIQVEELKKQKGL